MNTSVSTGSVVAVATTTGNVTQLLATASLTGADIQTNTGSVVSITTAQADG